MIYVFCITYTYFVPYHIYGISQMYSNIYFSVSMIFILSVILPYACPVRNIRFAYPQTILLFLMVCMCPTSRVECSVRPPYVFQWAIRTLHLVYALSSVSLHLWVWLYHVLNCVSCSKCYSCI